MVIILKYPFVWRVGTGDVSSAEFYATAVSDQAAAFIGSYSLKLWHAKSPHKSKFRRWKHRRAYRMDYFETCIAFRRQPNIGAFFAFHMLGVKFLRTPNN
ncbi:hypothetical protein [Pseudomonas fluorescens]|uniref:hypothetical protein n=1 Tax=Pseudomonas fluorescens TaxID=294 RepID=UPI0011462218|nr:hypothetical protein [Pseudomonas fluorescens]